MKKLICSLVCCLLCAQSQGMNKHFSLSERALEVSLQISKLKERDSIEKSLNVIASKQKTNEKLYISDNIYNLADEHYAWSLIEKFGLKETKLNVLRMEQELSSKNNNIYLKMKKQYDDVFAEKFKNTSNEDLDNVYNTALIEVASICAQFLKNISSISEDISLVKVDDENKKELINKVRNIYYSEGCGICKKQGADVFWFSAYSRGAHKVCFNLVKDAQKDMIEKLEKDTKSDNYGEFNIAHIEIVKIVSSKITKLESKDFTMLEYLKKYGEEELKKLFDDAYEEWCKK